MFCYTYSRCSHAIPRVVVLEVVINYYDFVVAATNDEHTDESLERVAELGYQLSESIKKDLLKDFGWDFPKFHLLFCHLVHAWRELGHPLNYSTAPYEHKHKPAKEDYRSASNNGKRAQMIKRMEMRQVLVCML